MIRSLSVGGGVGSLEGVYSTNIVIILAILIESLQQSLS